MEPQASQGPLGAEGDRGILSLLLPSPQSEAMTHEMEELSLQPTHSLPPLNERKNGREVDAAPPAGLLFLPAPQLFTLLTEFRLAQKLWDVNVC